MEHRRNKQINRVSVVLGAIVFWGSCYGRELLYYRGVTALWGVAATRWSCRMGDGLPPVDAPWIAEVMCIKDITVTHTCDTQISQP